MAWVETQQNQSETKNVFKEIWDKLKDLFNTIGNKFKEIFGITKQTKEDLSKLQDEILKINDDKLKDKDIDQSIEWKIDDENSILWQLIKNNVDIKNWFGWIKDISDEDTVSGEIENILSLVKEKSNNDSDTSKWDLTADELNEIGTKMKNKMELCDKVLKSDKIKDLPDDKKSKKAILEVYNKLLQDNSWDASKVTEDNIIEELNKNWTTWTEWTES